MGSLDYNEDKTDTHARAYPRDSAGVAEHLDLQQAETIDGTGFSESVKFSNCRHVVLANKTFTGSPREDDIDICRGSDYVIGPNDHSQSKPAGQNITVKGGVRGILLRGDFGSCVAGQYSIYDKWLKGEKTRGIVLGASAKGRLILWHAERPLNKSASVKVTKVPAPIVWAYFLFQSLVK